MNGKRTQKQIEAARRNGAKSCGPKTPEGKARSSKNALTHGLTSAVILLDNENKAEFDRVLAAYMDEWQPADQRETDLVHRLAADLWRLNRILSAEAYSLHAQIEGTREQVDREWQQPTEQLHIDIAVDRTLAVLDRYSRLESRIRRASNATVAQLRQLQADRRKREAQQPAALDATPAETGQNEPGNVHVIRNQKPASHPPAPRTHRPAAAESPGEALDGLPSAC